MGLGRGKSLEGTGRVLVPGRGRGSGRGHELEKMVYTKTNVRHTLAMHMSWLTGDLQIPENDFF